MKGVDAESLRGFLNGLKPQLEWARKVESELDRQMARRFNVLDYISTSELGLSRVIADLLNPNAAHGQGVLFLDLLLRGLKLDFKAKHARVETEHTIRINGRLRRLDILVVVESQDDRRCLAIENKPYAEDGSGQVRDYLDYLGHEYERDGAARHCLIYLSGSGEMPEKSSVTLERLEQEKAHGGFAVMPYCRAVTSSDAEFQGDDDTPSRGDKPEDDDDSAFLVDYTLADWFRDCRRACDVDRLRWFLGDAESFCEQRFGGNAMTDTTGDQLDEILMQRLDVVGEIIQRWPSVRAEVLKQFAGRLSERIRARVKDELRFEHSLKGNKLPKWETGISMTRAHDAWRIGDQCVSVRAEAQGNGAMDWVIGVGTTKGGLIRNALEPKLSKALGGKRNTPNWPWLEYVDSRWRWWDNDTILKLAQGGGEAEEYFVKRFCDIFKDAAPVIDDAVKLVQERDS